MEYTPAGTLRSTMDHDGFYPNESVTREWIRNYFLPVMDGVGALHEAGIIHRDLKPGNIFMNGSLYMAPGQFVDLKRTDERADIYSFL